MSAITNINILDGQWIALIAAIVVSWLVWDTYFNAEMDWVKSNVDDNTYRVRDLPDKQKAADLLAEIRDRCQRLIGHLEKTNPEDERSLRLSSKFRSEMISEGNNNQAYTSYSINKGERIVFCLRSRGKRTKDRPEDVNTLIFVAIHELAHIATDDVGHTQAFWDNFKWLLQEAIQVGIYVKEDYRARPREYCGVDITSSPIDI